MERLNSLTNELGKKIDYWECMSSAVSASPVGWHIEHALLTTDVVIKALEKSDAKDYKRKFSFAKLYVFTFNRIPRGNVQSTQAV